MTPRPVFADLSEKFNEQIVEVQFTHLDPSDHRTGSIILQIIEPDGRVLDRIKIDVDIFLGHAHITSHRVGLNLYSGPIRPTLEKALKT